nr:CHASE2 domain-containing protein [uncultured Desulfobulbus sp.]
MNHSAEKVQDDNVLCYRTLIIIFFAAILSTFFSKFDPFGVKSAASMHSEEIFMRVIGGPWYQSKGSNSITVVLVDEDYLSQVGESWPLTYIQQSFLLNDILQYEPKAIFLDFLYRHNHETVEGGLQQLVRTIDHASDIGVPIFLPYLVERQLGRNTCDASSMGDGIGDGAVSNNETVIAEIQGSKAVRTYIGWSGCGSRYPGYVGAVPRLQTPALALYRYLCEHADHGRAKACKPAFDDALSNFNAPMVVNWGSGVSRLQRSVPGGVYDFCTPRAETVWQKVRYSVRQLSSALQQSFSESDERGEREECMFTDTVHATWLNVTQNAVPEFLRNALKGKLVLVGAKVDGVNDHIITPVNGQVPGVYLFAMALDNYMTYEDDYFKSMTLPQSILFEISSIVIISFVALLWKKKIIDCYVNKNFYKLATIDVFVSIVFYMLGKLIIPVIISFIIAFLSWFLFNFAPMDWIGISALSFIISQIKLIDIKLFERYYLIICKKSIF